MACCPFHDDKNPSMKVDTRFHCFGCGADGDVIDFTSRLYNLSSKEAAEKLAQDFGLVYDSQAPLRRTYIRQKSEELFEVLLSDYRGYEEIQITKGRREVTEDDEKLAEQFCQRLRERWEEETK